MDTSEIYVKMCGNSEEIQSLWQVHSGDFFIGKICEYDWIGHEVVGDQIIIEIFKNKNAKEFKLNNIWLPRQDQLQEMFDDSFNFLCSALYDWTERGRSLINGEYDLPEFEFKSWEQLWLSFLMKEKFKKYWNGKEWLNGKGEYK